MMFPCGNLSLRDGVELDETSSRLTLPSLGLTDEGTYSCTGVNTLGVGLSDSLQIEVTGKSWLCQPNIHPTPTT